ncbi:MAG: zinc ribbon domain-containing protein [Halanaerobiales bacterium]
MLSRAVRCPDCGSHNHSGAEFCQKCGGVLYERRETPVDDYRSMIYFSMN